MDSPRVMVDVQRGLPVWRVAKVRCSSSAGHWMGSALQFVRFSFVSPMHSRTPIFNLPSLKPSHTWRHKSSLLTPASALQMYRIGAQS